MQKALFLALLIGAFLFPRYVTAQENPEDILDYSCPDGGTYQYHPELGHICSVPAPSGTVRPCFSDGELLGQVRGTEFEALRNCEGLVGNDFGPPPYPAVCNVTDLPTVFYTSSGAKQRRSYSSVEGICNTANFVTQTINFNIGGPQTNFYCPPDSDPELRNYYDDPIAKLCWTEATFENDCPEDNGDCEPPPGDCPPDTIGGCGEPEPDCFIASNGMEVCFEDPNDKCDVNTVNDEPVFSNCDSGCGFVNDQFLCGTEPDLPSLDDCLVTTNGYACEPDIPEPDDDINDPNKPIDDMVKNDFKDVMRGVESRTDATNKLLADQTKRDKDNTNLLAGKLDKSNAYLKAIDDNTKDISDSLKGDGVEFDTNDQATITSMLGITGNESIDDLTVAEISIDSFKDDFQWSGGSTACPAPRAINMLSRTFYMDWDPYCEAFNVISYFIMAAATLLSAFIAFGVKK